MRPRWGAPVGWFGVGSVHGVPGMGDPVVVVWAPDEGFLLGDLQVGGVNVLASGFVVPVNGRGGNSMGRIFLDLELPPGLAWGVRRELRR